MRETSKIEPLGARILGLEHHTRVTFIFRAPGAFALTRPNFVVCFRSKVRFLECVSRKTETVT